MKVKKKKKSNKREKYIDKCKKNIIKNKNKIWIPNYNDIKLKKIQSDSWFGIKKYTNNKVNQTKINFKNNEKYESVIRNCIEVKLILNKYQDTIIQKWFNAYIKMYNETLKYIKNKYLFPHRNYYTHIVI